jgi:hypothetical protein
LNAFNGVARVSSKQTSRTICDNVVPNEDSNLKRDGSIDAVTEQIKVEKVLRVKPANNCLVPAERWHAWDCAAVTPPP